MGFLSSRSRHLAWCVASSLLFGLAGAADAGTCNLEFLGKGYELTETVGGAILGRMNADGVDSGAVGRLTLDRPIVAGFGGQVTDLLSEDLREQVSSATASDLSDDGVVIGTLGLKVGSELDEDPDFDQFSTPFLWRAGSGVELLRETNPFVAQLTGFVSGISINAAGNMVIAGVLNDDQGVWLVSPTGSSTRISPTTGEPLCRDFQLNNSGQTPPGGTVISGQNAQNLFVQTCGDTNDVIAENGDYAGREIQYDGNPFLDGEVDTVSVTRNGSKVAGTEGYLAVSINSDGYIGLDPNFQNGTLSARPAIVVDESDVLHDLSDAIESQCDDLTFSYGPTSTAGVHVSEENHIAFATALLRPARAEFAYSASTVSGFGRLGFAPAVRVGNTFVSEFTVENVGGAAVEQITVASDSGDPYFEPVSGPTPAAPARLEPGESWTAQVSFRALEEGEWTGRSVIRGVDINGNEIELRTPRTTVYFVDSDLVLLVDTIRDDYPVPSRFSVTVLAQSYVDGQMNLSFDDGLLSVSDPTKATVDEAVSVDPGPFTLTPNGFRAFTAFVDGIDSGRITLSSSVSGTASGVGDISAIGERSILLGDDKLSAQIAADLDDVIVGELIEVEVTVRNESGDDLTNAKVTGNLSLGGDTGATVKDGPDPALIPVLGPGESAVIRYTLDTLGGTAGSLTIDAETEARDPAGNRVTATAFCSAGGALASGTGGGGEGGSCSIEGGAVVEVEDCEHFFEVRAVDIPYAETPRHSQPEAGTGYPPGAT